MRGLWETDLIRFDLTTFSKGLFLADESDNYQFLLPVLIRDFSLKLQIYWLFNPCLNYIKYYIILQN